MSKRDYYEVLGLQKDASADEIKSAFRQLAFIHHPDKGGDAIIFREVRSAYLAAMANAPKVRVSPTKPPTSSPVYDPFLDSDYENHLFFAPENESIAQFERRAFAATCTHCHGRGIISKLVDPGKGFAGRQERFCICQKIGSK